MTPRRRCVRWTASRRSSSSAATGRTGSSPRPAATRRSSRCRPAPTTRSRRCARRRSPASPPASPPRSTSSARPPGLATEERVVREPALSVGDDLALVDIAVSTMPFAGARALWRADSITELFVVKPDPGAVGLSAIAGQLATGPVHLTLGSGTRIMAAIAPGLVVPVDVARCEPLTGPVTVYGAGCLALDGEREIERPGAATVSLTDGPNRIDIDAVMRATRQQPREE